MGLSTDINQPLSTAATTCTGTSPVISCAPSHLGFYLTFLNSNTATASALFADAFLGFLEFTPIPAVANGAVGKDNILVALNSKAATTPSAGFTVPSLTLLNYGSDWQATGVNSLSKSDAQTPIILDD